MTKKKYSDKTRFMVYSNLNCVKLKSKIHEFLS